MSCLTCEVTPPEEKLSPERLGPHHIGVRFGDFGMGWAVLFRGYDVTLQTVEALAGEDGWVEMRVMTDSGGPVIHPGATPKCPMCDADREPVGHDPDMRDGIDWGACPAPCGTLDEPVVDYPVHVVTVIRRGMVQIVHGAELISGPPQAEPCPACGNPMHWRPEDGVWGCSHCVGGELISG